MKSKIIPSIMGKTQREIDLLFKKLEGVASVLHLDVADGKFVPNTSLWFQFTLSRKFRYIAHLMINRPGLWFFRYGRRVDSVIFHPECVKNISGLIAKIKKKKKKVGLALKPKTNVEAVKPYLDLVDYVLILTVKPGFYCAKYLKSPLKKIQQIKKINPNVTVFADGHMNPKTIKDAQKAGADYFVSGSYVSKSENPKKAIWELKKALR